MWEPRPPPWKIALYGAGVGALIVLAILLRGVVGGLLFAGSN